MLTQILIKNIRLFLLASIALLVVACAEDENSNTNAGTTAPTAVITSSNADAILMSSLESIQAKASANQALEYLVAQMKPGSSTALPPDFKLCGNSTLPTFGQSIDLINFCITTPNGMEITLDGSINFTLNGLDGATIKTERLQISTPNSGVYFLTLDITVSKDSVALSMNLRDSLDNEISTINLEVVGGMFTGITQINGSIMVANLGTVNVNMVESDPIIFDCAAEGVPSSGTIEITGTDNSSASITFIDCTSYTVTVNGEVTGNQIPW